MIDHEAMYRSCSAPISGIRRTGFPGGLPNRDERAADPLVGWSTSPTRPVARNFRRVATSPGSHCRWTPAPIRSDYRPGLSDLPPPFALVTTGCGAGLVGTAAHDRRDLCSAADVQLIAGCVRRGLRRCASRAPVAATSCWSALPSDEFGDLALALREACPRPGRQPSRRIGTGGPVVEDVVEELRRPSIDSPSPTTAGSPRCQVRRACSTAFARWRVPVVGPVELLADRDPTSPTPRPGRPWPARYRPARPVTIPSGSDISVMPMMSPNYRCFRSSPAAPARWPTTRPH